MESQPVTVTRRLAAIFAADAANFSRLVAQDEERTLRVLSAHRAVMDRTIRAYGGRVVATAGDSVLAEFASPVQAVRAAIEIQRVLDRCNLESGLASPMLFRIGINVGDVVVDGDNILGDDVNVAVRLEGLAPPGGICIAANVREHVVGKIDARLRDMGMQFLKNIPRPLRVYEIIADVARARASLHPVWPVPSKLLAATAAAVALLLAAWLSLHDPRGERDLIGADAHEYASWNAFRQTSDRAKARTPAPGPRDGLMAARAGGGGEDEARAKAIEASRAQAEALRLRDEAQAAAARAAAEGETAARLEAAAQAAARRAAAAARAAEAAQARLERGAAPAAAEPVAALQRASALDGYWTADWSCEASAERPAKFLRLPAVIQYREIRIEAGEAGLPGFLRAYGTVTEDGGFALQGAHLPRSEHIVGQEDPLQVRGRIEGERLTGAGTIGKHRCSVLLTRADLP